MNTDHLFYRLFETSPETLFLALGMSPADARAMAARYQYSSIELKDVAQRMDGVYQPKESGLPVYFVETQFYSSPGAFADILAKAYSYLKKVDPTRTYRAVVLFGRRSHEPEVLTAYQPLMDAGFLCRIFVNELPEVPEAPLGLSILWLIGQPPEPAAERAKTLVARAKSEIEDTTLRRDLLQLIETTVINKLPHLSWEEVQAMLDVNDVRHTRVFQQGREEGLLEGLERGIEKGIEKGVEKGIESEREHRMREKLESIPKLVAKGLSAEDIADALKLELSVVNKALGQK